MKVFLNLAQRGAKYVELCAKRSILETKPLKNPNFIGIQDALQAAQAPFGKHKIPRFLYHVTSQKNYESMLSDGYLYAHKGVCINTPSVYCFDLQNFISRFLNTNGGQKIKSLLEELNDIVILKIDTKGLNHNKLLCRTLQPREKFLEMAFSDKFQKFEPMVNKMLAAGKSEDEILFAVLNEVSPSMAHELFRGIPAQFSKLFKQQKKLIEFLYTQDIPMDKVEKIGSVVKSSDINSANPVRKFLEKLLEGAPEQKAIEFLTV